jgi:DNA-binding transcriptional MerR regulator
MELHTISQVSKHFNISTRTLRYYEQIELISSVKQEEYSYRTYDENTILRLQQIIILRKLRIPLKEISNILKSENVALAISTFQQSLSEVEDEIMALTTIKRILQSFIERLNITDVKLNLLDDESLLEIVDSLTVSKINFKEEKSMVDLNKANEKLTKLADRDVRIVHLPPATVAAYQYIGDEPEMHCNHVINKFVLESNLANIKPDLRHYGFNAPNPDEIGYHGYEMWVTIPNDMEVPNPIIKKHFEGGLYAAHMIPFGAFEEWSWLSEWVENNSKYEGGRGEKGSECMWGCLEEHLNYYNHIHLPNTEPEGMQIDLLHPIKEYTNKRDEF